MSDHIIYVDRPLDISIDGDGVINIIAKSGGREVAHLAINRVNFVASINAAEKALAGRAPRGNVTRISPKSGASSKPKKAG
jgi:flagellar basal body rod protein FlgF